MILTIVYLVSRGDIEAEAISTDPPPPGFGWGWTDPLSFNSLHALWHILIMEFNFKKLDGAKYGYFCLGCYKSGGKGVGGRDDF